MGKTERLIAALGRPNPAQGRPALTRSWEHWQEEQDRWAQTTLIADHNYDHLQSEALYLRSDDEIRRVLAVPATPELVDLHVVYLAMNAWGNQLLAYGEALDEP